jgi:hypothetical protein
MTSWLATGRVIAVRDNIQISMLYLTKRYVQLVTDTMALKVTVSKIFYYLIQCGLRCARSPATTGFNAH